MELSKSDKKAARILIERGLQKEYENALSGAGAIVDEWRKTGQPNQEAYFKLYEHVKKSDKQIGSRYGRLSGGNYIYIVISLYQDGLVTDADLDTFSEDVRMRLRSLFSSL